MLIYLKLFIPAVVILAVLIWLFGKPSARDGLRPTGGRRIKTFLAYLLIKSGRSTKENSIPMDAVNERIPPVNGKGFEDYNDSFVFLGMDRDNNLIVTRLGFREDGSHVEVWVWMIIDGKRYSIPVNSIRATEANGQSIEAGGLSYRCIDKETGAWRITYGGPMSPSIEKCTVELEYLPVSRMYHSGLHMDYWSLGKAMSEMRWSREYFEKLRSENQSRIEQGGFLKGSVVMDGRRKELDLLSIRDHSWGKRTWSFIYRYIWTVVALEDPLLLDGNSFTYLIFTTVDYGTTFKNLVSGWIAGPDTIVPISEAADMSSLGEDGTIPSLFSVEFSPKGMSAIGMQIRRTQPEYSWYMSNNTFEVCEAWCEATIGTIKGVGVSEFGYSLLRDYGRKPPEEVPAEVDPTR